MKKTLIVLALAAFAYAKSYDGIYSIKDSFKNGTVTIMTEGDIIAFEVDVINKKSANMCMFTDATRLTKNKATYIKKSEYSEGEVFEMNMVFGANTVEIKSSGKHDECGMNVNIDGLYKLKSKR